MFCAARGQAAEPKAHPAADDLTARRAALYAEYDAQLEELAKWCDAQQLAGQAETLRTWNPSRAGGRLVLFVIDDQLDPVKLPDEASEVLRQWQRKFVALRKAQADALFALARAAVEAERLSLAQMLLTETVRENPSHAQARAALGYQRVEGAWLTPFAKRMREQGKVWREEYGWINAADESRYAAGLRPFGNRWVEAEEDARLRRHISQGWQIETEHYRVTTNCSLVAGAELAARLERFYPVWRQLFAGYVERPEQMRRALEGKSKPAATTKKHQIVYYRTRDEYNNELRRYQPNIEITLGIYFDTKSRAFFFASEDQEEQEEQYDGTLYHEAAHQLFQETRRAARNVGRQDNFWIIEGIANYLESLTAESGYYTLGGPEAGRLPAARKRLLADNFYVPFEELVTLSMTQLQRDPNIAALYSQAAGQATFLMHYDEGRYREALVDYLTAVYQGTVQPDTLSRLTGARYDELDRQYRAFLQGL